MKFIKGTTLFISQLALSACGQSYNQPVYRILPPVTLEYYKCTLCQSYDGGIYGKGPLKHYRSPESKSCIHKWSKVPRSIFFPEVSHKFNVHWEEEGQWWQNQNKLSKEPGQ